MGVEETELIVLRDGAGSYYALPREIIERARVPDEHRQAIERALSDDTSGFAVEPGARQREFSVIGSYRGSPGVIDESRSGGPLPSA